MKDIITFINEASKKVDQWVAVSVTTAADSYHSKETTTQRVVSVDTYNELKQGRTKGYMTVKYVEKLSPVYSAWCFVFYAVHAVGRRI